MNTWNPRDEILTAAHRWYWIVASFLIGALLGWLVSFIWPASYRATLDLYVGLNAYRTTRDLYIVQVAQEEFRNLDDYKNWQMGQLNSLALSDEYLTETLTRLQSQDLAWQNVDLPTFRMMLSIGWRNAGDWHFSTKMDNPESASQAVSVWTQVVTEKVAEAVTAARQMVSIDSDLNAVSQALVVAETRQRILLETQSILADWNVKLASAPSNQSLAPLDHWNLLSTVASAASWTMAWEAILDATPEQGALPDDYLDWLLQVNAQIDNELALLPNEIAALQVQLTELTMAYDLAAEHSRALSANLEVKQIKDEAPQVIQLRPVGSLLLVGGILGVLILILGWFVQITHRTK